MKEFKSNPDVIVWIALAFGYLIVCYFALNTIHVKYANR